LHTTCYSIAQRLFRRYMNRGSLHSEMLSGGPLGEGFLRSVIRQMLEGLVYLHSRKLVHFDVKPTNVLLNSAAKVKIFFFLHTRTPRSACGWFRILSLPSIKTPGEARRSRSPGEGAHRSSKTV
jgi:serine/threonine protein kinase